MTAWTTPICWVIHPREIRGLGKGTLCRLRLDLDAQPDHVTWQVSSETGWKLAWGVEQVKPRSKAITRGIKLLRAAVARLLGHGPPPLP